MTAATETRADWTCPESTQVLRADADRAEWLAARQAGIGGSDAPVVMNESPYSSPYGLWVEKTEPLGDDAPTAAMQRGNWLEPHLADWFTEQTGIAVRRAGLQRSKSRPWQLVSVDRLSGDGGVVEVKTHHVHAEAAKTWRRGEIPRSTWWQGLHELSVTGRSHVWFVAFIDPYPVIAGPVQRDETAIADLVAAEDEFWHTHVLPGIPPAVDLATVTDDEIAARWPVEIADSSIEAEWPAHVEQMLVERAEAKATVKKAKDRADDIDRALRVMAGEHEVLTVDGQPRLTLRSQRNNPVVDKQLAVDHPDIFARYVTQTSSRRIRILKDRTT